MGQIVWLVGDTVVGVGFHVKDQLQCYKDISESGHIDYV